MLDPVIRAAVEHSFASQGAMLALSARIVELDDGECVLELPRTPAALQQHGYFHGGVIGALADSAGGYAANTRLMPARECLTVEYKINMLAPAQGERLTARGRIVRGGRTLIIVTADVYAHDGGQSAPCALAQLTMFGIDRRPSP